MDELLTAEALESAPPELSIILDCTGSMRQVMEYMPNFLVKYVVERARAENPVAAVSVVGFDDHAKHQIPRGTAVRWPSPVRALAPSENLEEIAFFLKSLPLGAGDDEAEAIACAVQRSRDIHHATNTARWLVTDAPPHGYGIGKGYPWDNFSEGCPCGTELNLSGVAVLWCSSVFYDTHPWVYGGNPVVKFSVPPD